MGKLKLKKAGKVVRRAGDGAARLVGTIAKVAEAVVVLAGIVERMRQSRRPSRPRPGSGHEDRRDAGGYGAGRITSGSSSA